MGCLRDIVLRSAAAASLAAVTVYPAVPVQAQPNNYGDLFGVLSRAAERVMNGDRSSPALQELIALYNRTFVLYETGSLAAVSSVPADILRNTDQHTDTFEDWHCQNHLNSCTGLDRRVACLIYQNRCTGANPYCGQPCP